MTPIKCNKHTLRPGEYGDSERYLRVLRDPPKCWRCRCLVALAYVALWLEGPAGVE
jgi:hypothetical protein